MDNFFLSALVDELRPLIVKRQLAGISIVGSELLLDLQIAERSQLRISLEPGSSYLFLSPRRREKANDAHPFVSSLRKHLLNSTLTRVIKPPLDRYVRLEFDTFTVSGEKTRSTLKLALTGRTANAYLLDKDEGIRSVYKLRHTKSNKEEVDNADQPFEIARLLEDLDPQLTKDDILLQFFTSPTPFSPLLKQEFISRCQFMNASAALASTLVEATQQKPVPILYSRLPLEEIGKDLLNLKTDLLLSHFKLKQAEGLMAYTFPTLSEAASRYYELRDRAKTFQDQFFAFKKSVARELQRGESLLLALQGDREKYASPERFKQLGDLLLSSLSTAKVIGTTAKVTDYYAADQSELEVEIGEGKTLKQAANDYFMQYQKARRALEVIAEREKILQKRLQPLRVLKSQLEEKNGPSRFLEYRTRIAKSDEKGKPGRPKDRKPNPGKPYGRWYRSQFGYEIVVGRQDKDNDAITFRLASPQDIWLHAADYPGSHVIIRNPSRSAVPMKVIQEAAELAAFNSQAKKQAKVAVHYTQKKFVSKPPRSKPGLVRVSSFKTILVEPKNVLERLDNSSHPSSNLTG